MVEMEIPARRVNRALKSHGRVNQKEYKAEASLRDLFVSKKP